MESHVVTKALKAALDDYQNIAQEVTKRRIKALDDLPLPSRQFLYSLSIQFESADGAELLSDLASAPSLAKFRRKEQWVVKGPDATDANGVRDVGPVSARSISLYPYISKTNSEGQTPLADRYGAVGFGNRVVLTLCDGLSTHPRAAHATNEGLLHYLRVTQHQKDATDLKLAGRLLLKSLAHAHNSILELAGADEGVSSGLDLSHLGRVCAITSLVVESSNRLLSVITARVGSCHCYVYSAATGSLVEATPVKQHAGMTVSCSCVCLLILSSQ